ncbi:hypothetical protein BDN71DRAFT_1513525 [Pleurotus eryngii]|uniref:Uncharacterized protein n=1 Tax=Pleurotus eryngii TaxID=5323 RepID=A0A9P5ZHN0_PLEER|nr:hypothetical protein BDN71DRAFT_1513525 [Pleurotus eryngii]
MEALPYHQELGPSIGPLFVLLDREKPIAMGQHLYGNIFSCPQSQSPIGFILKRPSGHLVAVNHSKLVFNAHWDDGIKKDKLGLNRVDLVFEQIALHEDSRWMITFELEQPDAIAEALAEDPRFAKAPTPAPTAKLLEPSVTDVSAEVDEHVEHGTAPSHPNAPSTYNPPLTNISVSRGASQHPLSSELFTPAGRSDSYNSSGRRPVAISMTHAESPTQLPLATASKPQTTGNSDNVGIKARANRDTPQPYESNPKPDIPLYATIRTSGGPSPAHHSERRQMSYLVRPLGKAQRRYIYIWSLRASLIRLLSSHIHKIALKAPIKRPTVTNKTQIKRMIT